MVSTDAGSAVGKTNPTPADIEAWRQRIRSSTFANYHYEMGKAFAGTGEIAHAVAAFDRTVAIDPTHAAAHTRMVEELTRAGRSEEARLAHERALQAMAGYQAEGLARLGWEIIEAQTADAAVLDEALRRFEQALALPDAPRHAQHGRVLTLMALRRYEEGLPLLPVPATDAPATNAEIAAHYHTAADHAWSKARRRDVARQLYTEALRLDPQRFESLYRNGLLSFIDEDLPAAESLLKKAVSLADMPAKVLVHTGMVQLAAGSLAQARASFAEAVTEPSHRAIAQAFIAYVDQLTGNIDSAMAGYDAALASLKASKPAWPWHHSWALSLRGLGLQIRGDSMGALNMHQQAERVLADRWVIVNIGIALDGLGRRADADEQYWRTRDLLPEWLSAETRLRPWVRPALIERLRGLTLI